MTFGKWITNQTAAPFYARRAFHVDRPVKRATARVTGLGQFNFYINGSRVSDDLLEPGWTDYRKRVQYYNGMAGIQPLAPGFARVRVSPWMPEGMNELRCTYETPRGVIRVAGSRIDGVPKYQITIPNGIECVEQSGGEKM